MKKIFLLCISLIIILFITGILIYEFVYLNDYTNSLYVVASSDGHTKFYEINDHGGKREVPRFDYDYENIYYPVGCFEAYIDRDKNKVLNNLTLQTCHIVDQLENEVEPDDTLLAIIEEISKLEHDLLRVRINQTEKAYYVTVELNVNWIEPYDFYKYEDGKLNRIISLDGEDILYVKEK